MLPVLQSAYRAHHSTETVLRVISDVFDAADSSNVTLLAFLDLSAVFGAVNPDILIRHLQDTYRLCENALKWIKSFQSNRTQTVSFFECKSSTVDITCGVPNGLVLGPLLFTLYIADAFDIVLSFGENAHFYTDDLQLHLHCPVTSSDLVSRCITDCIRVVNR